MWSTEEKCKQIHANSETQNGMVYFSSALMSSLTFIMQIHNKCW